jgi:hypothetical protein
MTQTSGFYTTSDTPSGHQVAAYTQVIAAKAFAIIAACHAKEGVAPEYMSELAGSAPAVNTLRLASGAAIVDGAWYESDASEDVNIPSAVGGGNTRIDRVVLRITWADYECVITRIAGTDAASPVAPAVTQIPGTIYDVPLYQVLVDTGGTLTLTDERLWARISTDEMDDAAVTTAKIAADAVTDAILRNSAALSVIGRSANSSGNPADIAAAADGQVLRRSGTALGFGQVATDGLADLAVTEAKLGNSAVSTAKVANDAIDDTKVGNRVPQFYRRQGGNANNWATYGTTTYTPTTVRQQAGVLRMNWAGAGESSDFTVTFPVAFSYTPVVIAQVLNADYMYHFRIKSITSTTVTFRAKNVDGLLISNDISIHWFAVGPE